jgi:hypothetical protein
MTDTVVAPGFNPGHTKAILRFLIILLLLKENPEMFLKI